MASVLDVVSGAIKLLGVRPSEGPIQPEEAQDGLISFNDMLNEWATVRRICFDFEQLDDVDDEVYFDDALLGPIKANLAVYIAPEYGRTVTPELALRAREGMRAIQAWAINLKSEYPDSLPLGSGNELNGYSPDGDSPGTTTGGHFYPSNVDRKCN